MTSNGNDGYRYSGIGRGSLRISLSSSRGARSVSSDKEEQLDAQSCYIAGLSLQDFPPIQPTTSSGAAAAGSSKLDHGGYGSDGIKVYVKSSHKYTGHGRGGAAVPRPGARSTLLRQQTLSPHADFEEEEKEPTGGYGSEGIKATGPVVPRGGLQAAKHPPPVETGPKEKDLSDLSSLESELDDY